MGRYIDVDKFLERMKRTPRYFDIKGDVESMPLADVVPRVEGHWETRRAPITECSVCGLPRNFETQFGWNYCPNCGANMEDGEEQ